MILFKFKTVKVLAFCLIMYCISFLQTGCYTYKWTDNQNGKLSKAPDNISAFFDKYPNKIMVIEGISPADYEYDAWEKDKVFGKDSIALHFNVIEIKLKDKMPEGTVIVDFTFKDGKGNKVIIPDFDLLRLIPLFNSKGAHLYPELLLEEFNRYGLSLRKEFKEFQVLAEETSSDFEKNALNRAYRASITNGCLAAGKWEFNLNSEDFSDFDYRVNSPYNVNQSKILAHSWFLFDTLFYEKLVRLKNPGIEVEGFNIVGFDYEKLTKKSQAVVINFDELRPPIQKIWNTKMLEVGHQSERQLELLDMEQHYKIKYGLFLNQNMASLPRETYKSILDADKQPISLAQFRDEGFYADSTALTFDMNWLQYLDSISVSAINISETDCLSEIKITGKWSPFTVTLTNIDLAQIQEQKLYGLHFGFNVYPKGRRYNPAQPSIAFDTDLMPKAYEQSVLLTETNTNMWVDNFKKGLGKVYLTYSTLERDVLEVYLISYERIVPLWMGRIQLPKELREKVRIRNQLYNYYFTHLIQI